MTDKSQTPDQQDNPTPPQEGTAPTPDGALPPETVTEELDLDKTLELPKVESATEETPLTPVIEPATPVVEQTTAVTPSVPVTPPPDVDEPATDQQPQQTEVMPQVPSAPAVADGDQTLGDTSDFTLTDITLTDAGGGLKGWLRGLRPRKNSSPEDTAGTTGAPISKPRHWGLRSWQWVLIGVGAVILVLAVLVGVDGGLYYGRVHHGIKVAGQNLSGMTGAGAAEVLTTFTEDAQKKAITLTGEGHSWKILPGELGATIDVPAAVSKAMALTRRGNVFVDLANKIELYFGDDDIPLEGTIDSGQMDALLTKIATTLDVPAVNATLVVNNGAIEVVDGKRGSVVDKEALRTSLTNLLLTFHSTQLTIPMVTTDPDLYKVDVEPALAQAQVMISGDLVITYKDKTVATLTPTDIVTFVDVAAGTGSGGPKTVPILSVTKLVTFFDTLEPKVDTPGANATFSVNTDTKTLTLVEGADGLGLDREATAAAMTQAVMSATGRTAEVVLKAVPPDLTTAQVEDMGIVDLLGDYKTTPYVGTKNRQINVRLATQLCSGVFLAPGEEFNTDKRLGVRDAAHGWAEAPGITGPGKLEDVLGGGICQVSTTLFNAALVSGLEITKRYNHSIFINHYPSGRDATVTAGGKNMCFRNDTSNYVFIYGWSSGINTHFYIFGVADGRQVLPIQFSGFSVVAVSLKKKIVNKSLPLGSTKESFEGQRSRSCSITRTVVYADGTTKSQTWASRWSMLPQVIETNPKPATTTTTDIAVPVTTTTAP